MALEEFEEVTRSRTRLIAATVLVAVAVATGWCWLAGKGGTSKYCTGADSQVREVCTACLAYEYGIGRDEGPVPVHVVLMRQSEPAGMPEDDGEFALSPAWVQLRWPKAWTSRRSAPVRLQRATWDAYVAANQAELDFAEVLDGLPDVELLTLGGLHRIIGDADEWRPVLRTMYPKVLGIVTMSAPGISPDGTQALVHIWLQLGPLSGWGSYVLLECRKGDWRVAAQAPSGVS